VVVKDGENAATSITAEGTVRVPALSVEVTESVGAGDAFAAGWLAAMLLGESEVIRLRAGHLMARAALTSHTDHGEPISLPELLSATAEESLWVPRIDHPITGENGNHAP
jgi:2-dehydro-3-deoxygluconokinase